MDESEAKAMNQEQFGILAKKCNSLVALSCLIAEQEAEIAVQKKELRLMAEVEIPEMMMEMEIEEIKTKSGNKVTLETFYNAKIPADKEADAFAFLEETNNDGIIKSKVECAFGKGDEEREIEKRVVEALMELDAPFTQKRGIHHSTLKAFVREQIESGKPLDLEMFGVYVGNKVKIRK